MQRVHLKTAKLLMISSSKSLGKISNGPYSSFSISCLRARIGGIMAAFFSIMVKNSGIINALNTGFSLQMH